MYNDLKDTQMFLVTEDTISAPITNVRERKVNDLTYVDFDTYLQSFERQNRNKRIYLESFMKPSFDSPHIAELIAANSWMGEAGHPMSDDPKRIMTIDPKLVSHKITKFWFENKKVLGHIQTLVTKYGKEMTALILQGMEPAFSLRAMAPMKNDPRGGKIQNGKAFIITYDWVFYPSHDDAYRDKRTGIQLMQTDIKANGNVMESAGMEMIVTESAVMDFIKDKSKNIQVVSSMWEIATENMSLTPDMNWAILKNQGDKLYVSVDEQIKHQVRNYMKSIY